MCDDASRSASNATTATLLSGLAYGLGLVALLYLARLYVSSLNFVRTGKEQFIKRSRTWRRLLTEVALIGLVGTVGIVLWAAPNFGLTNSLLTRESLDQTTGIGLIVIASWFIGSTTVEFARSRRLDRMTAM